MDIDKLLMGLGIALFVVMAALLRVGTTSLGLFLTYGVLATVGLGIATFGKKRRDQGRDR